MKITASRKALVEAALDAQAESVREVYDRFNLQDSVTWDTFRHDATRRRRERDARVISPLAGDNGAPPDMDQLLDSTLTYMQQAIDCRRLKPTTAVGFVAAICELRKLRVKEFVDKRAAELHEAKMATLRKAQNEALEGVSKSSQLTPEQVAEIRLKVLGL